MNRNPQYSAGFTLAELMLTLAIIGILMAVGAPSFNNATANARISSDHNSLVSALQLARSEAVKRNTNVAVCSRETGDGAVCGGEWRNGWLVFVDNADIPGRVDGGEEILLQIDELGGGTEIAAFGSLKKNSKSIVLQSSIRFAPRGNSNWRSGGSFRLCDARGTDYMRALNITLAGDIRRVRENQYGNLVSSWGTRLSCPDDA